MLMLLRTLLLLLGQKGLFGPPLGPFRFRVPWRTVRLIHRLGIGTLINVIRGPTRGAHWRPNSMV